MWAPLFFSNSTGEKAEISEAKAKAVLSACLGASRVKGYGWWCFVFFLVISKSQKKAKNNYAAVTSLSFSRLTHSLCSAKYRNKTMVKISRIWLQIPDLAYFHVFSGICGKQVNIIYHQSFSFTQEILFLNLLGPTFFKRSSSSYHASDSAVCGLLQVNCGTSPS